MCEQTKRLIRCSGCTGDLYCEVCFEDNHDEAEMAKHTTVRYNWKWNVTSDWKLFVRSAAMIFSHFFLLFRRRINRNSILLQTIECSCLENCNCGSHSLVRRYHFSGVLRSLNAFIVHTRSLDVCIIFLDSVQCFRGDYNRKLFHESSNLCLRTSRRLELISSSSGFPQRRNVDVATQKHLHYTVSTGTDIPALTVHIYKLLFTSPTHLFIELSLYRSVPTLSYLLNFWSTCILRLSKNFTNVFFISVS